MTRPRLLDLFCGAGGAAMGYHRAGFDVVGVDNRPQPHYPFSFVQADALEYLAEHGQAFDASHASPPCQAFTRYRRGGRVHPSPDLLCASRALLTSTGRPWILENVEGAPLANPVTLCGSMFGLDVRRHRLFESSHVLFVPGPCRHHLWPANRFTGGRSRMRGGAQVLCRATVEVGKWGIGMDVQGPAMDIDWMSRAELSQAIPPAYTHHLGLQLRRILEASS
jgi:DNA (cytosine-5)-methyltransferase 1